MKKKIITLSLIGILLISLLSGCGKSEDKEAAKSTEPDIMQVRSICKLATVECYYHNVAKSEKPAGTGIWHFGEKDRQFWIEYTGTVKLGIDMSKVQMKVNGTDVTVTIPEAEVQQVNVDDDSYNSDSYIFSEDGINKNEITAEDATGAVENARNEMIKTAEENTAADKEKSCKAVKKHRLVFNPSYWKVDFSDCIDNTDCICVCMVFRTACECCRRFHEAGS